MKLEGLTVVDADAHATAFLMLYVERPETARELVKAFPLAVAEWALKGLALADDDATTEQCFVCYVFHNSALRGRV